jgi:hypothetical protein
MKVRLGFAVAIHFLPDLLVCDEILSVGDFEFRQKCLHKINSLRARHTFLVVSHNLRDISLFCNRALLLHHGELVSIGEPDEVLAAFAHCHRGLTIGAVREKLQGKLPAPVEPAEPEVDPSIPNPTPRKKRVRHAPGEDPGDFPLEQKLQLFGPEFHFPEKITDISFSWNLPSHDDSYYYLTDTPWRAEVSFRLLEPIPRFRLALPFFNRTGELIMAPDTRGFDDVAQLDAGPHRLRLALAPLPVNEGVYWITLCIHDDPAHLFRKHLARFVVHNPRQNFGLVKITPEWDLADDSHTPSENYARLL